MRIPRVTSRRLAAWRVLCPVCGYSKLFLAKACRERDGLLTLPAFECARCGVEIEVAGMPIKESGTVRRGCCGRGKRK